MLMTESGAPPTVFRSFMATSIGSLLSTGRVLPDCEAAPLAAAALAGVAPLLVAVDLGLAGVPEKVALAAPLDSSYAA